MVAGIEAGRETSDPVRPTWTNVPTTSLLDPNPYQPFSGTETITSIVHTTAITAAAYLLDTIQIGKKWDLTGGLALGPFRHGLHAAGGSGFGIQPDRRNADLARGAGLQARTDREHLFRCGDIVQSLCRIALAERGDRESSAGEESDL